MEAFIFVIAAFYAFVIIPYGIYESISKYRKIKATKSSNRTKNPRYSKPQLNKKVKEVQRDG